MKIYLIAVLFLLSCKEPFQPTVTTLNSNILIVEGMINTGQDSTIINLSRTVIIAEKNTSKPEVGAIVTVESNANEKYNLLEELPGKYSSVALNLDNSKKYRLSIKTNKGVIYVSDFVETKVSPPIDEINWDIKEDGLQIYNNTHDITNKTRYYRWEYQETWEFNAKFRSFFISDGKQIIPRKPAEDIYTCWNTKKANNIILNSTIKLDQDIIYKNPITFIEASSEKLGVKYSILVKQYALTKEAFNFWQSMKKNTETLGSIFDVQPSQLKGNIYCISNPSEPVIGFISAGAFQSKRIFISKDQLPNNWSIKYPYDNCTAEPILNENPGYNEVFNILQKYIPVSSIGSDAGDIIGYTASTKECVDCTIRGTKNKPGFW